MGSFLLPFSLWYNIYMKSKYETIDKLNTKIEQYFRDEINWTPAMYRIYLGLSRSLLSYYKNNKAEYYNVIIWGESQILAHLEQQAIYNKDLTKTQGTSIIFTLRAYNSEQYVPEINAKIDIAKSQPQAVINLDLKSIVKGER